MGFRKTDTTTQTGIRLSKKMLAEIDEIVTQNKLDPEKAQNRNQTMLVLFREALNARKSTWEGV